MATWEDYNIHGNLPPNAFLAGKDVDNQPMYIGQAAHQGDLLPAKVIPATRTVAVSWNEREHRVDGNVKVLTGDGYRWKRGGFGRVSADAVEGGRTSGGETLYIGRVHHDGLITVGKVHPSKGVCYIPFAGKEKIFNEYEFLELKK